MVFGIIFLLSNTHNWLQGCSFEGKHGILCIKGFNYQALIRNLLVFQQFFTKSCHIYVFCKHHVCIFGKFCCFPCKKELWATLLRVLCEISFISPQNLYVSCQMYFYFVLCLCSIKSLHKIKFYACCIFA